MRISVQVQPSLASAVHGRDTPTGDVVELRQRLRELGVGIEPVHPGEEDPLLAPHFTVEVPDDEELAARVLQVLEESTVVDAAYRKPPDELP